MSAQTPSGFLTDEELEFYTGYKQPAAQIRFLQKWQVRHVVNGLGKVRVTWEAVNGSEKPRTRPNFASLENLPERRTAKQRPKFNVERESSPATINGRGRLQS